MLQPSGMKQEDAALPRETWPEHLADLADPDLMDLAGDYCWLVEKNQPVEERRLFRERRLAVLAECERRGLADAAERCRPSEPESS